MREAIARRLRVRGDVVDLAPDLSEAQAYIESADYQLIILDRQVGDQDSLQLLQTWRRQHQQFPVLLLTAFNEVPQRVEGFHAGADDFLGKPFAMAELLARVDALGRRATMPAPICSDLGGLHFDSARREVSRGGILLPAFAASSDHQR